MSSGQDAAGVSAERVTAASGLGRYGGLDDPGGRVARGRRIALAFGAIGNLDLGVSRVLDIGCSAGLIAIELATHAGSVIGIDVDGEAVRYAANATESEASPRFLVASGMALPFRDASYDAVVCNHVYEHTSDPYQLMAEIRRVLRPGGLCYFAAGHTLQLVEPHHRLPLLSWMPRRAADAWVRTLGRGRCYEEKFLPPWRLHQLFEGFSSTRFISPLMLREPGRFGLAKLAAMPAVVRAILAISSDLAARLAPTWIWLLRR